MSGRYLKWLMMGSLVVVLLLARFPASVAASPPFEDPDLKSQADAVQREAFMLFIENKHEEAISKFEEALAINREIEDRSNEVWTLTHMAMSYAQAEEYEDAIYYYEEASAVEEELGNAEKASSFRGDISMMYYSMGREQEDAGKYEQALENYKHSLTIWQELGSQIRIGERLNDIAVVYHKIGQYEEALSYHEQALAIRQEIDDQRGKANTLSNMGAVYHQLGQYDRALGLYQEALVIRVEIENQRGQIVTLSNIGEVYRNIGQYRQALASYQDALRIAQEIEELDGEGTIRHNIGATYYHLGEYEEALKYYEEALEITQTTNNWISAGSTLNNIGTVYHRQEQYEQALESYQKALVLYQAINDVSGESEVLIGIGAVHYSSGQDEDALQYYQEALTMAREIGERANEGEILNNIGLVYSQLGQYDDAIAHHQDALEIAQEVGAQEAETLAFYNIGSAYEQRGETSQAIDFYQQAIQISDQIRQEIKVEELAAFFANTRLKMYTSLINALWESGRVEEAFHAVEQARSRAFLDQLANGSVDFRAGNATPLLEEEQALKEQMAFRRAELAALTNRPINEWDREAMQAAQEQLASLEEAYEQLLTELKVQSPEVASVISVDAAKMADIQALLDPNTTLIEYFVLDERTLAFIITRDSVQSISLDISREELAEAVTNMRRLDFANLNDTHSANLQQLHAWLIAPLNAHLTTPVVGIVPHSVLHYLPFAALTDGKQYLTDHHILFSLPNASMLRFLSEKDKPNAESILALGNPTIDTPLLSPLEYADQEAEMAADLYETDALTKNAATESAVWSQASETSILHLAAHGQYNPLNPQLSTIHLAADEQNDGRLEAHEIYNLNLNNTTDLVVLSACQTQTGQASDGDEVIALNRAFLYAGSPTVIASLWNVDDKATSLFMQHFYTHLREGEGKAEALRQAQLDLRANETYAHPYYWAGFVLTGDGGDATDAGLTEMTASTSTPVATETVEIVETSTPIATEVVEIAETSVPVATETAGEGEIDRSESSGVLGVVLLLGLLGLIVGWGIRRRTSKSPSGEG